MRRILTIPAVLLVAACSESEPIKESDSSTITDERVVVTWDLIEDHTNCYTVGDPRDKLKSCPIGNVKNG